MVEDSTAPVLAIQRAIARIYKGNSVMGAGFWVKGGYVLTCAHVIRDALALKPGDSALGQTVTLNFPYIDLRQKLTAQVCLYRHVKQDDQPHQDIAGLRILDALPTTGHPAPLLTSYQLHNPYWVLGFPKGHPQGIASTGQLLMELPTGWVQMEDTKSQGLAIQPGFSGAPVWDDASASVVGMVVAREKDQPEAKIGFMVPARTLIAVQRDLDSLSLTDILQAYETTLASAIHTAYRLCCPLQERMPTNLSAMLHNLHDAKPGDSLFAVIDRFVALLSRPELTPHANDLRAQLHTWLATRVGDLPSLLDDVQPLLSQHQCEQAVSTSSHLLLYVQDNYGQTKASAGSADDTRSVSALFIRDASQYDGRSGLGAMLLQAPGQEPFAETVTLETLPQLIQSCLQEALSQSPHALTLHLILPLAWLNHACDCWPVMDQAQFAFLPTTATDIRIGVRFCCVLRITERLNPAILRMFREPWQTKWQTLMSPPADLCATFVPGDGLAVATELMAHLSQPNSVGLKLTTVYDDSHYANLFGVLIATGIPAALWLRQDQFSTQICPTTALDQLLIGKIATLPEVVKQCRTDALKASSDDHIGHHLAFLWEDPALIPPITYLSLAMP